MKKLATGPILALVCALLAPPSIGAQDSIVVDSKDVDDLDTEFKRDKAQKIADVATGISERVAKQLIKSEHKALSQRIADLEKAVGVGNAPTRIEQLETQKLNRPVPINVVLGGAAVITAFCALWYRSRRRPSDSA